MASPRPRVFTIPPSAPFLPTLITALAEGRLVPDFPAPGDPLALAAATIYLPTQRAARAARGIFLDALGCDAAVLPRLVALGDIDEDELIFAEARGPEGLRLPPPLAPLERRLLLGKLVLEWSRAPAVRGVDATPLVAHTPAAALALADALARLIDDMITREVPWERLDTLVPDHVDRYWQLTLDFLKVAREHWPAMLRERGAIEPATRRDVLIAAEARRLAAVPDAPVIAAGSTASMPSTAALLAAIARMPHGAVVLPGLDQHLDEVSWRLIAGGDGVDPAASHPQFAMHAFLERLGMHREEVQRLGAGDVTGREALVSEAMRPAAASERWSEASGRVGGDSALAQLAAIEAANAEEEALAIAIALREAVEQDKRAALVTPDRALARRVMAALARWQVVAADSAGEALVDTAAGVFARLAAEAAIGGLAPVPLLALLKHPLLRLGAREGAHAPTVAQLEHALLRGPRPRAGSAGLAAALDALRATHTEPRGTLAAVAELVAQLAAALAPLESLAAGATYSLSELAGRHRAVVEALSDESALAGDDGTALLAALEAVETSEAAQTFALSAHDYAEVFPGLIAGRVVGRGEDPDARVHIYGLLEARLQHADRVVLGGLVEGVWPPQVRCDPWLSRPMRQALGLDLPERRIGLTAHDFAQALGVQEVILSRPAKLAGAPTVASRFVQRLAAVAGKARWTEALQRGERFAVLARGLDRVPREKPLRAPAPCPPVALRPRRLSVTEIEDWLRDPYTIYAKHILKIRPLDPVDTPPGARDRGTALHAAIGTFTQRYAGRLPDDPEAALLALGEESFAPFAAYPEARAFWWPRFERIARWFAEWEKRRRAGIATVHAEVRGTVELPMGDDIFTLSGVADRIELAPDGSVTLLDYKTGRAPSDNEVRVGLAPQLTLEAAMLRRGGFPGIPAGCSVAGVSYVQLRGGEPPGEERMVDFKRTSPDAAADQALARLATLVAAFAKEEMPYRSLVHPMWKTRYGDYDHLARVREWSATGGVDDPDIPS